MPNRTSQPELECTFTVSSPTQGVLRAGPVSRPTAEAFGARLRRALMRDVEGAAVSAVRIEGAADEFALLDGVREDVVTIVETLKGLRVGLKGCGHNVVSVAADGPSTLTAADLARDAAVTVGDPAQAVATVEAGGRLAMTVEISRGAGYRLAERRQGRGAGWLAWAEKTGQYSPRARA